MGTPSSALLSEIYLQHLEHNQVLDLLKKHKIISYHRYVDDKLIVYNTLHMDINKTLIDFNNVLRKMQFIDEEENNNQINFIDLSISRTETSLLQFGIFRKPTATDIIIHSTPCHPTEHKISDINYLINRAVTYPISKYNINKEKQTIDYLLKANGYRHLNARELTRHRKQHTRKYNNQNQKNGQISRT
jgi:hypothetical protein